MTLEVPAGKEECFYETVQEEYTLSVEYQVGLYRISGLFYIRYPTGYPVSFAGYPAGRITGYSAGYPVKLLNKRCELRMSKLI